MKVLLKTALNPYSGYGQDGVALAQALMRWGCDVYLQPCQTDGPLPVDVLMLLTKHMEAPFDLSIVHRDPAQLAATPAMVESSKITVGWSMWEWETMFRDEESNKLTWEKRFNSFDVVASYDENSSNAFQPHTDKPIVIVQGGYDVEAWPFVQRDWSADPFKFAMEGSLHSRKGVFHAIEAFKELKDEFPEFSTAELHLKTVIGGLHPKMSEWCPGIHIYREVWRKEKLQEFYNSMHVLLCPSRGEGKNLPALQFMSTGGVVVATNWGGHTQWLSDEYAYPLNYVIEADPSTGCRNATPDKSHLKALMLGIFRDRAGARQKAETAARVIPLMCSWDRSFDRLLNQLARVHPRGSEVRDAALRCRQEPDSELFEDRQKSMSKKLMGATT